MKKISFLCAFLLGFNVFCASAQVFSSTGAQKTPAKANTNSSISTKVSEKNSTENDVKVEADSDSENFPKAKKNFYGTDEQKNEYRPEERSVYRFKIVNGEIIFEDDDASRRDILVYYDNFELHQGMDGITRCSFRLYVLNDLTTYISAIGFKLIWPNISTSVSMNQLKPGVKTYTDMTLLGDGCLNLNKTPTIEVNRCRVKGMTEDECADAVRWYPLYTKQ